MAKLNKKELPKIDGRLQSIGIIMDGNGRWAKRRLLPRTAGHVAGAKVIQPVLSALREMGIHHVTLYAFSTENWKRPDEEVNCLMELIYKYLDEVVTDKVKTDKTFSMRFLGDKARLPEKLRNKCIEIEELSGKREFICNIALNYGGRDEIVHAVNEAIKEGCSPITAEDISRHLYTSLSPDPDLIIRTGGDLRVSNFLIWQGAYSELYVTDTLWPDFGVDDIAAAVGEFYKRKRRFGGLDPEDTATNDLKEENNEG